LLAQQAAAVLEPPAPAATQGQVYGSSVMTNLGHVWINQVFNAPLSTGERTDQLILHYLAHVQGNADRLVLGTDVQDSDQERMSLQRVFTMLQADFYGPIAGDALLQSLLLGSSQPRPQLQDSTSAFGDFGRAWWRQNDGGVVSGFGSSGGIARPKQS